jgi:hypothetical protein
VFLVACFPLTSFAQQNESFLFTVDKFQILGNLPGELVDHFTNGIGDWVPYGDVTQAMGSISLRNPGAVDNSPQTIYPIRIFASGISAPPAFDVANGGGNFTAEAEWYQASTSDNQVYSLSLSYPVSSAIGMVTQTIQMGITHIDETDKALFGLAQTDLSFFTAVTQTEIATGNQVLSTIESSPIPGAIISGPVYFRMEFDDENNRFSFSFKVDNNSGWPPPFAEMTVNNFPTIAEDVQWSLNAGVILLGYPVFSLKMPRPPVLGTASVEPVYLSCSQGTDETIGTGSHSPSNPDRRYAVDFDSPNLGQNGGYDDLPVTASIAGKARVIIDDQSSTNNDHNYGNHVNIELAKNFYVNDGTKTDDPNRKLFVTHAHLAHLRPNLGGINVVQGEFLGIEGETGLEEFSGCDPHCDHVHFGLQFGNPNQSAFESTSIPFLCLQAKVDGNPASILGWHHFDNSNPCSEVESEDYKLYKSTNVGPRCNNGVDDDSDNTIDYAGYDSDGNGSANPQTGNEEKTKDITCNDNKNGSLEISQCDDDLDNDADGTVDWDGGASSGTPDQTCIGKPQLNLEKTQCDDGLDNDNDNNIDYPADLECANLVDDCEALNCGCGFGFELVFILTPLYLLYSKRKKFF